MKRSKPRVKYQGFALEIPLINEIRKHIKNKDEYRTVTDFVRSAIREKLTEEKKVITREMIKKEIADRMEESKKHKSFSDDLEKFNRLCEEFEVLKKQNEKIMSLLNKDKDKNNNGVRI